METIGRDLHRQFPLHEMFVSPQGHGYEASDAQGPPASRPQLLVQPPLSTLALCFCISRGHSKTGEGEGGGETWAEAASGWGRDG